MRINNEYADVLENPSYKVYPNSILVVLPVIALSGKLSQQEKEVLDILSSKNIMSRGEIEKKSGLGKDKTIRILNELLEKRIIRRTGKGRGTKYEFIPPLWIISKVNQRKAAALKRKFLLPKTGIHTILIYRGYES